MNIAICFFGQVKNYTDHIYESFLKYVLSAIDIKINSIDYYLITFNNTFYYNPGNNENHSIDYESILSYFPWKNTSILDVNSPEINDINNFANYLVDNYDSAWYAPLDPKLSTQYSLRQQYQLNILYSNISKDYNKYILLRPDALFTQQLFLDAPNETEIIVPKFGSWGGYNDRFAVINSNKALEIYCDRYNQIKQTPQQYHSEKYLKQLLDYNNISVYETESIKFRLVRANDQLTDHKY